MNWPKIAIIIVNWNGKRFLKGCLKSVLIQSYKNFDVYFVDNGSIDGSSDYVRDNFKKVKIIQLDKNYGFAKGNNDGIREAFKDKQVEYIACLNNDTIVDKNWLRELIKTAEKDEKIGVVQSRIYLGDKETIHSTGGIILWDFASESRDYGKKSGFSMNEERIDSGVGCSLLLKRTALEKSGLFEELYGSYKEDDEICLKMKKKGFMVFYSPKSIVFHLHSQTLGKQSIKKIYLNERNRLLNLITFGSIYQILFSSPYTIKRYLSQKNMIDKEKNNSLFKIKIIYTLLKANVTALFLSPSFLVKRWKLER